MKQSVKTVIALFLAIAGGIMLNNGSPTVEIRWWIGGWEICNNPNFNIGHLWFWPAFAYLSLTAGLYWRNRGK